MWRAGDNNPYLCFSTRLWFNKRLFERKLTSLRSVSWLVADESALRLVLMMKGSIKHNSTTFQFHGIKQPTMVKIMFVISIIFLEIVSIVLYFLDSFPMETSVEKIVMIQIEHCKFHKSGCIACDSIYWKCIILYVCLDICTPPVITIFPKNISKQLVLGSLSDETPLWSASLWQLKTQR